MLKLKDRLRLPTPLLEICEIILQKRATIFSMVYKIIQRKRLIEPTNN